MNPQSLQAPVFATYVVATSIMILKTLAMAWLTVWRMMRVNGGFRSPEDVRRTPLNRRPDPRQLEPDERVERIRRIQLNDLESVPYFLIVGLLFLLTQPSHGRPLAVLRVRGHAPRAFRGLPHRPGPQRARGAMDPRMPSVLCERPRTRTPRIHLVLAALYGYLAMPQSARRSFRSTRAARRWRWRTWSLSLRPARM